MNHPERRQEKLDARYRSKNPNGRLLNVAGQQGVQAIARRYADRHPQFIFEELLDADEVERTEAARRVVVDKEIEIAVASRLVASSGPEQKQRGRAARANFIGAGGQFGDGVPALRVGIIR